MSNTEIVIFSKDRTLQLASLLKSLTDNSDIDEGEIPARTFHTSPWFPAFDASSSGKKAFSVTCDAL